MFQYALLLGIKYKNNSTIIIDPQTKENSYLFTFFDLKEYELAEFNPKNTYIETYFPFNKEVFSIEEDTNFAGYFQTEKYFKHCKKRVRKEFTFKKELVERVTERLKEYRGKNLVSLHVRRGDYLANPTYHPQPSNEYYYNAMDMLDDGNTVFVCVSNDIQWCKENLKRDNLVYEMNDLIFDMCLISKCNNHIIANSTFSWWGAWLGNAPNKKVIAPKIWFGPAAGGLDTKDIYCDDFIIL
jgi:hypothetical protein